MTDPTHTQIAKRSRRACSVYSTLIVPKQVATQSASSCNIERSLLASLFALEQPRQTAWQQQAPL